MTVIHIGATMINAEGTIKLDNDVDTLKMLARQLLKERKEAYEILEQCRDFLSGDKNCGPYGLGLICIIDESLAKARGES